ncbi:MAG: protein translocase subunit SecF [Actinomycetota bacterium]|nr:protein translocase subunit SecF [Actinomycetota bacterium]
MRQVPVRRNIDFVGKKYIWFAISGVAILVSIIGLFTRGLNFGIDFTGGTQMEIRCDKETTISDIRKVLSRFGFGDAQIQQGQSNTFIIRTPNLSEQKRNEITAELKKSAKMKDLLGISDVGPGWGAQVSRRAIIGVIIFLVAVVLYVSIRFEFKMAISAIVEIFHDTIITVGVYALIGREVTPATIIAFLTLLGYSLYDAIVIFDRLKENADALTRQSKKTYSDVVNDSVNQILARSINTSLTTLFPIVTILLFGGETLKAFAFALFLGVLTGTYSSIFVATPMLAIWKESEPKYATFREKVEKERVRERRTVEQNVATNRVRVQEKQAKTNEEPSAMEKPAKEPAKVVRINEERESRKPTPKPKPKAKSKQTSAKARTKGPGSRKKKKKKR